MSEIVQTYQDIGGRENVYVPLFVDTTGQYGRIPSSALLDISGIYSPNFTVGGKPIMFADGTASDGSSQLDFQAVYFHSKAVDGAARISLQPGKDFAICDAEGNSYIEVDAATGKITIHGEMAVVSAIAKFEGAYQEFNHLNVLSTDGSRTALLIEPKPGVEFLTNPVQIKTSATGPVDFSINPQGQTYIRELIVDSIDANLIDGVDFDAIASHLSEISEEYKHHAFEIKYQPELTNTNYVDYDGSVSVSDALNTITNSISNKLDTLSAAIDLILQDDESENSFFSRIIDLETSVNALETDVYGQHGISNRLQVAESEIQYLTSEISKINTANIAGINFEQYAAATVWTIHHNTGSNFIQFTTYDEQDRLIWPDEAFSLDHNTFIIVFGSNQAGRAILSCLIPPVTTIFQQPVQVPA